MSAFPLIHVFCVDSQSQAARIYSISIMVLYDHYYILYIIYIYSTSPEKHSYIVHRVGIILILVRAWGDGLELWASQKRHVV